MARVALVVRLTVSGVLRSCRRRGCGTLLRFDRGGVGHVALQKGLLLLTVAPAVVSNLSASGGLADVRGDGGTVVVNSSFSDQWLGTMVYRAAHVQEDFQKK